MSNSAATILPVILVVDDEVFLRLNATAFLEDAGFQTVEAANAAEAFNIMEIRSDIRILFTDVQMPGSIDGIELAQKVHDHWPNVLLLMTSGKSWPLERPVPDHGHFLPKPYSDEAVITEICALEREAAARRGN